MKFLADENIPELTLDLLRKQEVDIVSILSVGTGVKDRDVLRIANEQESLRCEGGDEGRSSVLKTHDYDARNFVQKQCGRSQSSCIAPI